VNGWTYTLNLNLIVSYIIIHTPDTCSNLLLVTSSTTSQSHQHTSSTFQSALIILAPSALKKATVLLKPPPDIKPPINPAPPLSLLNTQPTPDAIAIDLRVIPLPTNIPLHATSSWSSLSSALLRAMLEARRASKSDTSGFQASLSGDCGANFCMCNANFSKRRWDLATTHRAAI